MEGGIDPDAPLDYAEFELFPGQNRYEVCACSGNKVETIESGLLEHLLLHSPEVKNINSKKLNATFKIQVSDSPCGAEWFTKSILKRFLHIIGSPNILHITKNFDTEISRLEETRRFQLSIDVKGHQNLLQGGKTDGGKLNGMAPTSKVEVETVSLDASKNELLRAMNLRIAALKEELAVAFNQATGTSCSLEELMALEIFSHHFGAMNLRNSLRKFLELNQEGLGYDLPTGGTFLFSDNSRNRRASKAEDGTQVSKSSPSNTPVKYGVSPAKVAQLERRSSTESEESSFSSEEEQPAVERSRTHIRSASPRRSASPMRRVQIGRSGSRRASALTIRSLSYYPGRERVVAHMDAANSEEEGSEQGPKKSENNAGRISVQAAISLFESKQKDQIGDIQKAKSFNTSTGVKKSVLRRWSSGMGESSAQSSANDVFESHKQGTPDTSAAQEISQYSQDLKQKTDSISGCQSNVETLEIDFRPKSPEERSSGPIDGGTDAISIKHEENNGKSTASAECGRQKEAELNQLPMKMMESKPVKYQKKVPDNGQLKNVPGEHRGGLYDDYKQKGDEKLRGEVSGKLAEKEAQLKAMQKFFDERQTEMGPTNVSGSGRHVTNRAKKSPINSSSSASTKKEISKPAVVKRTSAKTPPLPATRKSWPSIPLPRDSGISPAKTPVGTHSTGSTDTRRKSKPASALPRSIPKVERVQPHPKTVKTTQVDSNKGVKVMNEKKQQTGAAKTGEKTITKTQTASGDHSSTAKPSLYNKMTKKSSVVPLESKPFLRKGSGTIVSPVVKTKVPSLPEELLRNSRDVSETKENELVTGTFDIISQQKERDSDRLQINSDLESESQVITFEKYGDTERPNVITSSVEENIEIEESIEKFDGSTTKPGSEEESSISPAAWVDIEEEYRDEPVQYSERSCQNATATNVAAVGLRSPRVCHVRHSLSQMLLEESSEPYSTEWGNAEIPPTMVYQKDAPKGLKRLLKFARKSKIDTHLSGLSSPPAFSEGEDEAEEYKGSRKNADNLLRKSALNVKNYGPQKTTYESYEKNSAQSSANKFAAQSAHKMQEAHISAPVMTSKVSTATATRSFFSLSAFKGSKPNETKLR